MATDIFAKIGDIKGESQDNRHRDEVDVISWSWGVSQTGSQGPGGGGGGGRPTFADFTFTHNIDKASPNLMKACATGQHLREATITARKAGQGQQDYLIIKLRDVIVTGVSTSLGRGADDRAENVSLQYAGVDLEYKPQNPDGSFDAGVHFVFDVRGNRES